MYNRYETNDSEKEFLKALGDRIKTIRKERGMKQPELAELCEMSGASICDIERGNRPCSLTTIMKIEKALGVRLIAIASDEDKKL